MTSLRERLTAIKGVDKRAIPKLLDAAFLAFTTASIGGFSFTMEEYVNIVKAHFNLNKDAPNA